VVVVWFLFSIFYLSVFPLCRNYGQRTKNNNLAISSVAFRRASVLASVFIPGVLGFFAALAVRLTTLWTVRKDRRQSEK